MSHTEQDNQDHQDSNENGRPLHVAADDEGSQAASEEAGNDPEAKIALLEQELNHYKDRYVRAVAEMENIRRRSEKERSDLLKYGLENTLKDLLPVLDSFELAVPSDTAAPESDATGKSFQSGVLMVKKQMLDILKKHGLEQIEAKDKPFDPNFHQAIQRVESSEHKEETVAGEFQKGYVLNGRLIRPAMVSVFIPV
jgi:molecular chaperone GrpE